MRHLLAQWRAAASVLDRVLDIGAEWRETVAGQSTQGMCGHAAKVIEDHVPEARVVCGRYAGDPHCWNELPDGTIVDVTACQFGHDGIRVVPPGDPEHENYREGLGRDASLDDYGGGHQPPRDGAPLYDLTDMFPEDVYTHPQYYTHDGSVGIEGQIIREVRDQPYAMVDIYRSLPPNAEMVFDTGNWVALDYTYAADHGAERGWDEWVEHPVSDEYPMGGIWERNEGDWPVITARVPAQEVRNGGNDIIEWGYWGPQIPGRVL